VLPRLSVDEVIVGLRLDRDNTTWFSEAPGEPGWSSARACKGCFANWDSDQPAVDASNRTAVMSRDISWKWAVRPYTGKYALLCERELPGQPMNLCGIDSDADTCDPETTYEWSPYWVSDRELRYRVRLQLNSFAQARQDCIGWGGDLVTFGSDDERALVVRFGPKDSFWIGLQRTDAVWSWVGDNSDGGAAAVPWSSSGDSAGGDVGAVMLTPGFDTNLVQAASSATALSSYVCRRAQ
jgi:hypothetical protein